MTVNGADLIVVFRCRYLEEAGCASICINSCKVPTQEFFRRNMGMDVSLEPNYDDFSCQFAFGKKPLPQVCLCECVHAHQVSSLQRCFPSGLT